MDQLEPDFVFADAESVEAEDFEWGARKTVVNAARMPGAEQTLALVWILPGQNDPPHRHPNAEMIAHVLQGECEFQLGDALYNLVAGDTIRVPRGVPHSAACAGWEPVRLIVAQSAPAVETVLENED
jgi:quercetin dioxygenase-like cupin family protein